MSVNEADKKQNPPISLGLAKAVDEDFIKRLSRDAFALYGSYEDVIVSWLRSDNSHTIVARVANAPIGFAMLGRIDSRYDFQTVSELLAIAVESSWQGMGVGESLLREADLMAVQIGIKRIFLHTATDNIRAQRLFNQAGYRFWEIRRSFYPRGQDAYVMAKEPD